MRRAKKIVAVILIVLLWTQQVEAAVWSGNGVYQPSLLYKSWGVTPGSVAEVSNPGAVYSFSDITSYSAYITNMASLIGTSLPDSFYWYNKSRLAYVKLLGVTSGAKVSFVFSGNYYVYCAQYDANYKLLYDGDWLSTGDVYTTKSNTRWIMVVFRQNNGNLTNGSGTDLEIIPSNITALDQKYIIFSPFTYTFQNNGGTYGGSKEDFKIERLGVAKINLPVPVRSGYVFGGWKNTEGSVFQNSLPAIYNSQLFKDTTFTALWTEKQGESVELDKSHLILEEGGAESMNLHATVLPEDALNKHVTWSSSDTKVAVVDEAGKVTGVGKGVATITATTANGKTATCKVYIMGFDVSVPSACTLKDTYEIHVSVFYNGEVGMTDRKKIVLEANSSFFMNRVGDAATKYEIQSQTAPRTDGDYSSLQSGASVIETMDTASMFLKLVPKKDIKKTGDYEGNITFTVSIR